MSHNPCVSIILPTYNGEKYLSESIQSVLNQTFSDWELIIVDDASSDRTPEMINQFVEKDARIHCIRHEKNRRLPGALNTGFNQAKGDYFTWTSDDNRYQPSALQEMVNFLKNHANIDFVYTDYDIVDATGNIIEMVSVESPEVLGIQDAIGGCFLYKRSVHEKLTGYDEELFLAEDLDFWLRTRINFSMAPLHKNLYQYRDHAASLSQSKSKLIIQAHEQVLKRHLPQMAWMNRDMRSQAFLRLASRSLAEKAFFSTIRYSLTALTYSPFFFFKHMMQKLAPNCQSLPFEPHDTPPHG